MRTLAACLLQLVAYAIKAPGYLYKLYSAFLVMMVTTFMVESTWWHFLFFFSFFALNIPLAESQHNSSWVDLVGQQGPSYFFLRQWFWKNVVFTFEFGFMLIQSLLCLTLSKTFQEIIFPSEAFFTQVGHFVALLLPAFAPYILAGPDFLPIVTQVIGHDFNDF